MYINMYGLMDEFAYSYISERKETDDNVFYKERGVRIHVSFYTFRILNYISILPQKMLGKKIIEINF